jgi:transcriptional regulator GlxA family with amidase domain
MSSYRHDSNILNRRRLGGRTDASPHPMRDPWRCAPRVAATTARWIVVPRTASRRPGPFIERAVPDYDSETFGPLLQWIIGHPRRTRRRHPRPQVPLMSLRTSRAVRSVPRPVPPRALVVTQQRVLRAEEPLEQTDRSVEWIAPDVGWQRRHPAPPLHPLARCEPQQYRRSFRPGVA